MWKVAHLLLQHCCYSIVSNTEKNENNLIYNLSIQVSANYIIQTLIPILWTPGSWYQELGRNICIIIMT